MKFDLWLNKYIPSSRLRGVAYPLSVSLCGVYWTFYTPSTIAASHGWNFVEPFLAPILGVTVLFPLLRRIGMVARREKIGSLADFLATRYGKSRFIGILVTAVAGIAMTFFIAQQLKTLLRGWNSVVAWTSPPTQIGFFIIISIGLAALSVGVGAKRPTFTHHNPALVSLTAIDGALKLIGICFVAALCLWHWPAATPIAPLAPLRLDAGLFMTVILLTGAIPCVPHVYHFAVVESEGKGDLEKARRFLPVYFSLAYIAFVIVTWTGSTIAGLDPQTAVLGVTGRLAGPAMAACFFILTLFTAAVLVGASTYAVATMVSDQISLSTLMQNRRRNSSAINVGLDIMQIRRLVIVAVVAMGCLFAYLLSAEASSTVGLLFGSLVIQLLPGVAAAVWWRRAHRLGVSGGILFGVAAWALWIVTPQLTHARMTTWLPFALAAAPGTDMFAQRFIFSFLGNVGLLAILSLWAKPRLIDEIQAAAFIDFDLSAVRKELPRKSNDNVGNLKVLLAKFLGEADAAVALQEMELKRGQRLLDADFVDGEIANEAERKLAGVVGNSLAASLMRWRVSPDGAHAPEFMQFVEQTSQAIRLNREMLQATLNNLSQGVCVVDKDFRYVAWNDRYLEIFDLQPNAIQVGTSMADVIRLNRSRSGYSAQDTEEYIRRRVRDVRIGIPHVFERKWSIGKTLRVIGLPMSDGRYVTSFTDVDSVQNIITDLREANQKLEERVRLRTAELTDVNEALRRSTLQAERARASQARFLAAASHDLLQPLHAARLFLGALQEQVRGSETTAELARNADVSIENANRLLNALLNLSRLEVGGLRPEVRPVDVNHLFNSLRREFDPLAKSRGLQLRIVPTRLWVKSDEDLLQSILQNLIGNAVRYTQEGAVLVACRRRGDEVLFEVRDSGPGIAADALENIFQEYVRLPQSRQVEKGLGLGLSIVKKICDVLGHRVIVRSSPGVGTTFGVVVPASGPGHVVTAAPAARIAALGNLSVLCVEDDVAVRTSLASLLKRWEVTATFANGVDQALALNGEWDAILSDYHFESGRNGLDLADALQGHFGGFALITADSSSDVAARAAAMGVAVIRKPVAPATLRSFLSRVRSAKADGAMSPLFQLED